MTWAADQRQAFIKQQIDAGEQVNRIDVASRFNCTKQTVAADLARFQIKYPGLAVYDAHQKAYVRADLVSGGPIDWKARATKAEAQRDAAVEAEKSERRRAGVLLEAAYEAVEWLGVTDTVAEERLIPAILATDADPDYVKEWLAERLAQITEGKRP